MLVNILNGKEKQQMQVERGFEEPDLQSIFRPNMLTVCHLHPAVQGGDGMSRTRDCAGEVWRAAVSGSRALNCHPLLR